MKVMCCAGPLLIKPLGLGRKCGENYGETKAIRELLATVKSKRWILRLVIFLL